MQLHTQFKFSALAVAIAGASATAPVYAFEYVKDEFRLQVDTTVSVGASWRASDRDYQNVGLANATAAGESPHLHGTGSQDNGNLNWKKGSTFSEVAKATIELEMNYRNYGAFVRGKAFYDHRLVNGDGRTDQPAFYNPAEPAQSAGTSADILDAFVWGDWWLGDKPLNVRLGKQVINWGEGLFFPNGINTINPIDVNALLAPGSEVKDALIPLNALYASIGLTDALTLEGFALFEWKETELPECGTFFSTTDLVGPNCWGGFYPSGLDTGYPGASAVNLPRGSDIEPGDSGQFGAAARYFATSLDTEFAVYYINYHSSLPIVSGHMPNSDLLPSLVALRNYVITGNPADSGSLADTASQLNTAGLLPMAEINAEYHKNIELLGASFNTTMDFGLPGGATAVAGEISMRKNQPFQMEDGDTLAGILGLPSLTCADAPVAYDCYTKYAPGEFASGAYLSDYYQAELSFIHFFDQVLGASRWTVILDVAGSYVNMPGKDEALLNSSYNATLNHPYIPDVSVSTGLPYPTFMAMAYANGNLAAYPETDYYPTSGAWGYKMRFSGDYNNVIAGINLKPTISFSHDVYGTTPGPITNFLEDRKALGLSLEGVYQNTYSVTLAYTEYFGAQPYNQLADRDYISLSAQASF